ncbi:hypothetical protein VPNG_08611 [Cytospora leucostoma]|uniref:Uncharacterized protein n=1 Tax=Cytospora leucostoma TaxID=1230097 RepID=A0A423W487_9PEZI|nr:hypothetical protein VPNG_08611 [Cytospora leucostoma]
MADRSIEGRTRRVGREEGTTVGRWVGQRHDDGIHSEHFRREAEGEDGDETRTRARAVGGFGFVWRFGLEV